MFVPIAAIASGRKISLFRLVEGLLTKFKVCPRVIPWRCLSTNSLSLQSIMTPYVGTVFDLTLEIISSPDAATEDQELWQAVLGMLRKSFEVDEDRT